MGAKSAINQSLQEIITHPNQPDTAPPRSVLTPATDSATSTPPTLTATTHTNRIADISQLSQDEILLCDLLHAMDFTQPSMTNWKQPQPDAQKSFVINLSNLVLDEDSLALLNKGLGFGLSSEFNDLNESLRLTREGMRRLDVKLFFAKKNHRRTDTPTPRATFNIPSTFWPRTLELAVPLTEKIFVMLTNLPSETGQSQNLTRGEKQALKKLKNNKMVTVKKADKGSSVTLMNTQDYVSSCRSQLNDTKYYRELKTARSQKNAKAITRVINNMRITHQINEKTADFLTPPTPHRPRIFYGLPKVHKNSSTWKHNIPPLRPIISDVNSESYQAAKFVDFFLKPWATTHKAYLKDTWHFLEIINRHQMPAHTLLVSMDVVALYTNIPLLEGINLCRKALDRRGPNAIPTTKHLIQLLEIQAFNNDFEFNGATFLQIHGTAMGKTWAPSLANIFMAEWESTLFQSCQERGILHPNKLWVRFLDDIFFPWEHGEEALNIFIDTANKHHGNITITADVQESHLNFLDVTLYKGPRFPREGRLDHKSFRKPTDKAQYLHASSAHPGHTHVGLMKGLLIRLQRLNSQTDTFEQAAKQLYQNLLDRGYNRRTLTTNFKKFMSEMTNVGRTCLVQKTSTQALTFACPFTSSTAKLPKDINTAYNSFRDSLQSSDETFITNTLGERLRITFKKPPTLANKLVRTITKHNPQDVNSRSGA